MKKITLIILFFCLSFGVALADGLPSKYNFDIDANGAVTESDGMHMIRYLFGLYGNSIPDNYVEDDCNRCESDEIIRYLVESRDIELDIDGNGNTDALTDGLLAIRYFLGWRGSELIDNAIDFGCTRCTAEEIEQYIEKHLPATKHILEYKYDSFGRLEKHTAPSHTFEYTYDNNNNRESKSVSGN